MLGDGQSLQAIGKGSAKSKMKLPNGKTNPSTLHDVFFLVPDLAYNLFSVTSASKRGKVTTLSKLECEIKYGKSNLLAVGYREGSLYYLDNGDEVHEAHPTSDQISRKAKLWRCRFGNFGAQGMEQLARSEMVEGIDFDWETRLWFL